MKYKHASQICILADFFINNYYIIKKNSKNKLVLIDKFLNSNIYYYKKLLELCRT